jgi:hypothetical protein
MLPSLLLMLALTPCFQQSTPPIQETGTECLLAAEKKRLSEQDKVDGRIKVYRDISERYHQTILAATAKRNFDHIEQVIRCWQDHLAVSMKDIETNVNRKKKSGALINYEIQLRKSIVDMNNARLRAVIERQPEFDSWISLAQKTRTRFVDILFQR